MPLPKVHPISKSVVEVRRTIVRLQNYKQTDERCTQEQYEVLHQMIRGLQIIQQELERLEGEE